MIQEYVIFTYNSYSNIYKILIGGKTIYIQKRVNLDFIVMPNMTHARVSAAAKDCRLLAVR